jgi:hypothetical protein
MLKLTLAVVAVVLAGSASAAGWRSMRLDASDGDSFAKSVAAFQEALSPARRRVFTLALADIWNQGKERAQAQQREYPPSEYYQRLDGLSYEEIVALADPTGETTKARYREASLRDRPPPVRLVPPETDPVAVDGAHPDPARHRRRPDELER